MIQAKMEQCLFALAGLAALAAVVTTVLMSWQHTASVPFWDMLAVEAFLEKSFIGNWSPLKALEFIDNEHRPVFPMYLFAIDYVFFYSRGTFLIFLLLAMNALLAAILARIGLASSRNSTVGWLLVSLTICLLFWPGHWENLTWPKQVHVYLSLVAATIAFVVASGKYAQQMTAGRIVVIASAGIVAMFSFGYGTFVLPIILGFAISRRWQIGQIFTLVITTIIGAAFYASSWRWIPYHADPITSLISPLKVAIFSAAQLGAPFHFVGLELVWVVFGGLLGVLWICLAVLVRGRKSPSDRAAVLIALFVLACTVSTAFGRINFGIEQALVQRYLVTGCLFWIALAIYYIPRLPQSLGIGICLIAIFAVLGSHPRHYQDSRTRWQYVSSAAVAALLGIDSTTLELHRPHLHPSFEIIENVFANLATRRASVYTERWPWLVGLKASQLFHFSNPAVCRGAFESAVAVPPGSGFFAEGWAWDLVEKKSPKQIFFLDSDDFIRGFAFTGIQRPEVNPPFNNVKYSQPGWSGYFRLLNPSKVRAAALLSDGRLCPFGTGLPITVPHDSEVANDFHPP